MDKQSRVRIPRHLVYSPAQIAARVGISVPDARNRMAAGFFPDCFKSGEGAMARWWGFAPSIDRWIEVQQRPPTVPEQHADQMIAAIQQFFAAAKVEISFTLGEEER